MIIITTIGTSTILYRKETPQNEDRKKSHQSNRTPYEQQQQTNYQNDNKTSVKVHNPPGGKTSFTLG